MKKSSLITSIIIAFVLLVSLSACVNDVSPKDTSGTSTSDSSSPPIVPEKDDWTLLIYLCGSNLESKAFEASKSLDSVMEADIDEKVNVVIQTGGSKRWKNENISENSTDRYIIENNSLKLIERIGMKNFGDSDTLKEFIDFGVTNYPAEKTGLIFWNHGGGSIKGVCFDENFKNDSLTLSEIKNALASASPSGGKWEFIGFDACLMATYDTACALAPYADYMIASEELEPSSGWDYKTLVSNLGANNLYDSILTSYAEKQSKKTTYTLSVIKLSELGKADEVIEKITEQINYDLSFVGKALSESKEFGSKGEGSPQSNLFDLGLMAKALGIEYDFSSFITNVNGTAHEGASGISLYFPAEKQSLIDEYSAVCSNKDYIDFLTAYLSSAPETTIKFVERGYKDGDKLSFALSESSNKYIRSVVYELRSDPKSDDSDKLYCVGTDNDVSLNNGVYTVDFKGNWVFLNDTLLHCDIYEETKTYTVFSALVKANGQLGRLLITYLKSTHAVQIDGYTLDGDVTSRINDIAVGTQITVLYEDEDENFVEEATITWAANTKISIKKLDAGTYQYIPYVVDIYGSVYAGSTATVYFDGEKVTIVSIAEG